MRKFVRNVVAFLAGSSVLCLFCTFQKITIGEPLIFKGYIVPFLFGGTFGLLIVMWRSKFKEKKERIGHLNIVLNAIKNVNHLLIKEKDRARLLQGICDSLIEKRDYYSAAWIVLLDQSIKVVTSAEAGFDERFSPLIKCFETGNLPYCARQALKQPDVLVTKDPLTTCTKCPLSSNYSGKAAMTVRLEYEGKVFGLLCVSISSGLCADEEERKLFKEIADDIVFVLHGLKLEEERKRMEYALIKSEKLFRDLIENSLVGISIIQDDKVIYRNPEQQRLIGPLPDSILLTNYEGIHPNDVEKVKIFYDTISSGKTRILDTDFRFYPCSKHDCSLEMRWVYCRASLIEYQGKDAILVNTIDITKIKELEHLLGIKDKMTSLGRVTAGIAHEIRNPLSGINIYLNTLEKIYEKTENSGKVREIIQQIQSASGRIESTIKRVMDFSRPSEPKFVLTDINQPVEDAIQLSSVTLRKTGIKIEKDLAGGLPMCKSDAHMITQVVLNLINNAAEAMKNTDGEKIIEIKSYKESQNILVSVSDSGPGVPSTIRNKIFDPFYTTKNGSTGIGLSLCNRIVKDHGGSLHLFTSKWGGARFVIKIPIEPEIDPHTIL
ncbi:PAS domain S-box protein [bacterium]|nr:PAS domain S-box protein [bacterium]